MRRREFVGLVGGATVWPFRLAAQHGLAPKIGFLGPTTYVVAAERVRVFEQRLQEIGWAHGRTVTLEYRWADGHTERFGALASDLVQQRPDVLITWGTATAVALKEATSTIPIVFTIVGDPVGSGLVISLAKPSRNVTGLSTNHPDTATKRLALFRELIPALRRLAVMANVGNSGGLHEMHEAKSAAQIRGIETTLLEVRRAEDITPAITSMTGQVDGLYVAGDALFNDNRIRINTVTLAAKLPTMHGFREIVAAGGLISYGPDYLDLFRRAADLVDKILRGSKPQDIPVEQPSKFELVINSVTAKALGLAIPSSLLARADEVIE